MRSVRLTIFCKEQGRELFHRCIGKGVDLMRSKKVLLISLIAVVSAAILIAGVAFISYNVNMQRLNAGKAPVLVFRTNGINDGGSEIYNGLGFHIVKWHSFIENTGLEKSDYNVPDGKDTVYVCGWDIKFGYSFDETLKNGPDPETTLDFRLE